MLGQTSAGGLGALGTEVSGGELLVLPGGLGGISPLLVDHGKSLGNGLSNNLNKMSQEECSPLANAVDCPHA